MTDTRTKDQPCCAHLRVTYSRLTTDGITRGWWECEDCGHHFAPVPREPPTSEQCLHEFVTIDSAGQLACRWCAKLFNFRLAGLGDLLAVIHGDGGHYLAEQGPEKAVADAIDKYNRLLVELDHLQYAYRKRTQDAEQTVDDDAPDASEQLRTSNPRAHLGWHIVDRLRREGGTITWADGRVEVVAADVATVKHEGT